ncbi:MAG: nitrate ABC transporter, permease protein, partial [Methylotenera sp.]
MQKEIVMSAISVNKKHLKQIGEHVKTSSDSIAKELMLAANEDNTHMKMIIEKLAEKTQKPAKQQISAMQIKVTEFFKAVIPPIFGILMFLGIWTLLSHQQP